MNEKLNTPGVKVVSYGGLTQKDYLRRDILPTEEVHKALSNYYSHIDSKNPVFGSDVLEQYMINRRVASYSNGSSHNNRSLRSTIEGSKNKLASIIRQVSETSKESQAGINLFFDLVMQNPDVKKIYLGLLKNQIAQIETNNTEELTNWDLANYFQNIKHLIPDDMYIAMITMYQAGFKQKNSEQKERLLSFFNTELPDYLAKFANRYQLDNTLLQQRLSSLKNRLILNFTDADLMPENASLGSTKTRGDIILNPFNSTNNLELVLVHEVIHNLAGAKYRILTNKKDYEGGLLTVFYAVPEKKGTSLYEHLGWFDEGVTEMIAEQVYPSEILAYPNEISLIEKILDTGKQKISRSQLFKAYFEGIDIDADKEKRLKETKEFYEQVSQAWSPGFLNRLDKLIQMYPGEVDISLINRKFEIIAKLIMTNDPVKDMRILFEIINFN